MKTHITLRAKAQQDLEDAQNARNYEAPTEVMCLSLPGEGDHIEYVDEDVEDYIEAVRNTSGESAADALYDWFHTGGGFDTRLVTRFLEWLQSVDLLIDPDVRYWLVTGWRRGTAEATFAICGPCNKAVALRKFDNPDNIPLDELSCLHVAESVFSSETPIILETYP